MKLLLSLGLLLAAAGCRSRAEPLARPEPAAQGAMARREAPEDRVGASEREIALENHDASAASASYLSLLFGADPAGKPQVKDLGSIPALMHPQRGKTFTSYAAFSSGTLAYAARDAAEEPSAWRVELRAAGAAPRRVSLGRLRPTALHLVGEALYAGVLDDETPKLGWFDLTEAAPSFRELNAPERIHDKEYDLFARSGSRLLAIDDQVSPIYASWIELDARGHPAHHEPWVMPSFINGHYTHATLAATGAGHALFAIGHYGIMSGSGHDLVAMQIKGRALLASPGQVINSSLGGTDRLPTIEEHVPRRTGDRELHVAGNRFTAWTGVAFDPVGGRVLVAAGERGLFSFAPGLPRGVAPDVIDVGGECRDVRLLEPGVALVLVARVAEASIVVLRATNGRYAVAARHALPMPFHRFLR